MRWRCGQKGCRLRWRAQTGLNHLFVLLILKKTKPVAKNYTQWSVTACFNIIIPQHWFMGFSGHKFHILINQTCSLQVFYFSIFLWNENSFKLLLSHTEKTCVYMCLYVYSVQVTASASEMLRDQDWDCFHSSDARHKITQLKIFLKISGNSQDSILSIKTTYRTKS